MPECMDCGKSFNYFNPENGGQYYEIVLRDSSVHGAAGRVVYCTGCVPFGNTKIPELINGE